MTQCDCERPASLAKSAQWLAIQRPLEDSARVVANCHGVAESWQFLFREQSACIRILQLFLASVFERIAWRQRYVTGNGMFGRGAADQCQR